MTKLKGNAEEKLENVANIVYQERENNLELKQRRENTKSKEWTIDKKKRQITKIREVKEENSKNQVEGYKEEGERMVKTTICRVTKEAS